MTNLRTVFYHFRDLLKAFWLFMAATLSVSLIYILLMATPMGVDTLLITGEGYYKMLFLIPITIVWAALVWFSSRIVGLVCSQFNREQNRYISHLPRYLAANCFIAIQCSILSLRHVINLSGWWIVLFIATHTLYYILLSIAFEHTRNNTDQNRNSQGAVFSVYTVITAGLIYICWMIWLSYSAYNSRPDIIHAYTLPAINIILFGVEIIVLWTFIFRRKRIEKRIDNTAIKIKTKRSGLKITLRKIIYCHYLLLKKLKLERKTAFYESPYYLIFHLICVFGLFAYGYSIVSVEVAGYLGPLLFSILAISVIVIFFNFLSAISRRINFNVTFVLFVILLIVGLSSNDYGIRHEKQTTPVKKPISAAEFTKNWLNDEVRRDSIDTTGSKPYIAYLILNDGGGSRAAAWSGMVLSKLQDETNGKFGDHIFAMAGASGGSVGNCAFYGLLKHQHVLNGQNFRSAKKFFHQDFLTHTLGRMFGPDFIRYIPVINTIWCMNDRAVALESTLEYGNNEPNISSFFAMKTNEWLDTTGHLPALFINTTDVKYGTTAILGNVRLTDNYHRNLMNQLSVDELSINMSTAAVMSARFPYISPAGGYNGRYYVDGGYFDNSGAGTLMSFMKEVYATLDTLYSTKRPNIIFHTIEIHNGVVTDTTYSIPTAVNDLLAPIQTLMGVQNASTQLGNYNLKNYMAEKNYPSKSIPVQLYCDTIPDEEDYPMSWINSYYQLDRIEKRMNDVITTDTNIVQLIKSFK